MATQLPTPPPRPITARAAENGLYLGAYICLLAIATGLAMHFPAASFVVWGGSLAMPFFLYRMLRRSNAACGFSLSFAELWAEGIASFFLGALLPALLSYAALRYLWPTFIADSIADAVAVFRAQGTAEFDLWAQSLENISAHAMPTPVDVAAQLIAFNIMVGTGLSMIMALVVKISSRRQASPSADRQ